MASSMNADFVSIFMRPSMVSSMNADLVSIFMRPSMASLMNADFVSILTHQMPFNLKFHEGWYLQFGIC